MSCTHENTQIYNYITECGWEKYEGEAGASLSKMFQAANILTAGTPYLNTVSVYVTFKLIGN